MILIKKVSFFDSRLLIKTFHFFLSEGSILGFFDVIYEDVIRNNTSIIFKIVIITLLVHHVIMWIFANKIHRISLYINDSLFEIKTGDIFNEDALKVINFNEYFDTIVNNKIISEKSLNGYFIKNKVDDLDELNNIIDKSLESKKFIENKNRLNGKKKKYDLGTLVNYHDEYLLTSFTRFDEDNRAYTSLEDYFSFFINFWNNLDIIYSGRNVAITLFGGSNLSRFKDAGSLDYQDLIELILLTFKTSGIKFKNKTKITLVIPKDLLNKVNLYGLKEMYNNGL